MDRDLRRLLARNIRAAADAKGITLERLADFADVSKSSLFAVLRSASSPTVEWLSKIAEALDVDVADLLRRQKTEKKKR